MIWSQQKVCGIVFIRPSDNLECLNQQLDGVDASLVIDMTGGDIASQLPALDDTPQWNGLHLSRIRRTDDCSLDTTGHTRSVSALEIAEALNDQDTSRIILLDDTSFSGNTNILAERALKEALQGREIALQHAFLIANEGDLAPGVPGAFSRLGSVLAGHRMSTPRDDGWHVFDIVQQPDLDRHIALLQAALHTSGNERGLFPGGFSTGELNHLQTQGKFVAANGHIDGEWHTKNPQLLPRIIAAGHVEPIDKWANENEVFDTLLRMGELLQGDDDGKE